MTAKAVVGIEVEGERRAMRAMRGLRRESSETGRATRDEAARTRRAQEREAERGEDAVERSERRKRRAAKSAGDERTRIARQVTREIETQARLRERTFRRLGQAAASAAGLVGRLMGNAAIGAAAGARAAVGRLQSFGGALGVRSREGLVADTINFERQLQGLAARRGLNEQQTEALRGTINTTATDTGRDQSDVLGALSQAQSRFAEQFDDLLNLFPEMSRAAGALEADFGDVVTVLGNIRRANPELSLDELREVLFELVSVGNRGSVEFAQFAQAFGTLPGRFAASTQRTGIGAVRESIQVAQVLAAGGNTDSGTATEFERLLQRFARVETQRNAKRLGIDLTTNGQLGGPLRPLLEIAEDIRARGRDNPVDIAKIVGAGDVRSTNALNTLLRVGNNEDFIGQISGASADEGRAFVDDLFGRLQRNNALQTSRQEQFAALQREGGARAEVVRTITDNVTALAKFEAANLKTVEALGIFQSALVAVGTVSFLRSALGGRAAGGAAAAAAPGIASGLGATTVAGATAGTLGVVGGTALGAVSGGREIADIFTGSDSVFAGGLSRTRQIAETEEGRARIEEAASRLGRLGSIDSIVSLSVDTIRDLASAVSGEVAGERRREDGGSARRN